MALSNQLISQFAKMANAKNSSNTANTSTTVYGKVVDYNGHKYVQLDGSDLLTPVETTTSVGNGDRVTVKIENHTATVTGNLSDPSASSAKVTESATQISEFEIIIAHKVVAEELEVTNAYIENLKAISAQFEEMSAVTAEIEELQAKIATIDHLTAIDIEALNAEFENLRAKFGEFDCLTAEDLKAVNAEFDSLTAYVGNFTYVSTDVLEAIKANIKELDVDKLSAKDAEIKYANIDFANIDMAAIEKLFSDSGIIDNLVVSEGHITGVLVGVTIKGDLIEAGTVKADRLVVKGSDGIYYKLNIEGGVTSTEEVSEEELQNGLHGDIIVAHTITAEKINVDDLVAFDATIGGFNITNSSIYSGVKESVDNTTRGIYLDKTGQVAFGDASNFLKFYKDADGNYKLELSASSVVLSGSKKDIETELANTDAKINEVDTGLRQTIAENSASIINDAESIILQALESYTDSDDFNEFRESVRAELAVLVNQITMNFTESIQRTEEVNGELQTQINEINKYFTFNINGLTIGQANNPYKVVINNDRYSMLVNGVEVMWIANGRVYTPEIEITKSFELFGYALTQDANGNVNCAHTGG